MIAAGGTGGHVYPAIAIADAIKKIVPDARFLFIGTRDRMEWKAVPAAGYEIVPLWISGFHRRLTWKNLLFPLKLLVSLRQSRKWIRKFRPHAVLSCGGFAAGPPGWMAARMGVPLFIQEQNSYPGVTNRKLAPHATKIFTAFEETARWFPPGKAMITGNPVRQSIIDSVKDRSFIHKAKKQFEFDPQRPVLLVMGGSGGAKSINDAMLHHLPLLHDRENIQILWQCGKAYLSEIREKLAARGTPEEAWPNLRLVGFMEEVTNAWAAADILLTRAGATTCSELLATGKAGILVPSPFVAADHQTKNAQALAEKGAALWVADDELMDKLPDAIRSLLNDPGKKESLEKRASEMAQPEAVTVIAEQIVSQINKKESPSFLFTHATQRLHMSMYTNSFKRIIPNYFYD